MDIQYIKKFNILPTVQIIIFSYLYVLKNRKLIYKLLYKIILCLYHNVGAYRKMPMNMTFIIYYTRNNFRAGSDKEIYILNLK